MEGIKIWVLLAGLALFMFGMRMLEESLRNLAGRSFKKFLRKYTENRVEAVASGMLVTMLIQSSSMVTLLVMSFAGAGLIGIQNGIGMIMGANLGTTVTGWLVTLLGFKLDIGSIILPVVAVGGLGSVFLKADKPLYFSRFLLGFSLMFLGLDYMKDGFVEFAHNFDFSFLIGKHSFFFVLIGFVLTASIQSSSGAMMIYLSSLAAGIITVDQGFYLVIGGEIGTTVSAIIGTINGNSIRKKVGWSQFAYNIINAIVAVLLMGLFRFIIMDVLKLQDPLMQLVAFHSIFNLAGIVVMLPLLGYFTRFIDRIIPSNGNKQAVKIALVSPEESNTALEALEKEADCFLLKAIETNSSFFHLEKEKDIDSTEAYFLLKKYEEEVLDFSMKVLRFPLTKEEVILANHLGSSFRNATLSAKDLKDVKHNLEDLHNSGSDHLHEFYHLIKVNQQKFYDTIRSLMQHLHETRANDLEELDDLLSTFYRQENDALQKVVNESKHRDMDMPSLLNMLRDVNSSNEALIRALEYRLGIV